MLLLISEPNFLLFSLPWLHKVFNPHFYIFSELDRLTSFKRRVGKSNNARSGWKMKGQKFMDNKMVTTSGMVTFVAFGSYVDTGEAFRWSVCVFLCFVNVDVPQRRGQIWKHHSPIFRSSWVHSDKKLCASVWDRFMWIIQKMYQGFEWRLKVHKWIISL